MWEIEPAKRNEKHVTWCEGKRMQRQSIASMFPSSVAEKVKAAFCEASPSPKPRLLKGNASGSLLCQNPHAESRCVRSLRRRRAAFPPFGFSVAPNCVYSGDGKARLVTDVPAL